VLDAAKGFSNTTIALKAGVSRKAVVEMRQRFVERGLESVLGDSQRSGRPTRIEPKTVEKITETVMASQPKHATHWTTRSLATKFRVGRSSVQRILASHDLQPHRTRSFKFSRDRDFAQSCVMLSGSI